MVADAMHRSCTDTAERLPASAWMACSTASDTTYCMNGSRVPASHTCHPMVARVSDEWLADYSGRHGCCALCAKLIEAPEMSSRMMTENMRQPGGDVQIFPPLPGVAQKLQSKERRANTLRGDARRCGRHTTPAHPLSLTFALDLHICCTRGAAGEQRRVVLQQRLR